METKCSAQFSSKVVQLAALMTLLSFKKCIHHWSSQASEVSIQTKNAEKMEYLSNQLSREKCLVHIPSKLYEWLTNCDDTKSLYQFDA